MTNRQLTVGEGKGQSSKSSIHFFCQDLCTMIVRDNNIELEY